MQAWFDTTYHQFASLPCWRPVVKQHACLASKYDERPGLPGWLWRLFHNRDWQKSSLISGAVWVIGTVLIYKLVARLGYGVYINASVSLGLDLLVYYVHKLWVFRRRRVGYTKSTGRTIAVWLPFFLVNFGLAYLLYQRTDLGTLPARGLLGCYGLVINPVMFMIKDRLVFNHDSARRVLATGWRTIRKIATT